MRHDQHLQPRDAPPRPRRQAREKRARGIRRIPSPRTRPRNELEHPPPVQERQRLLVHGPARPEDIRIRPPAQLGPGRRTQEVDRPAERVAVGGEPEGIAAGLEEDAGPVAGVARVHMVRGRRQGVCRADLLLLLLLLLLLRTAAEVELREAAESGVAGVCEPGPVQGVHDDRGTIVGARGEQGFVYPVANRCGEVEEGEGGGGGGRSRRRHGGSLCCWGQEQKSNTKRIFLIT